MFSLVIAGRRKVLLIIQSILGSLCKMSLATDLLRCGNSGNVLRKALRLGRFARAIGRKRVLVSRCLEGSPFSSPPTTPRKQPGRKSSTGNLHLEALSQDILVIIVSMFLHVCILFIYFSFSCQGPLKIYIFFNLCAGTYIVFCGSRRLEAALSCFQVCKRSCKFMNLSDKSILKCSKSVIEAVSSWIYKIRAFWSWILHFYMLGSFLFILFLEHGLFHVLLHALIY